MNGIFPDVICYDSEPGGCGAFLADEGRNRMSYLVTEGGVKKCWPVQCSQRIR